MNEQLVKIDGLGPYHIYTNQGLYDAMSKEFNELRRLLNNSKNSIEAQLKRQEEFFVGIQIQARQMDLNINFKSTPKDIHLKLSKIFEIGTNLGKDCRLMTQVQQKELQKFSMESNEQISQFHKFLQEYILNTIKAFQQDDAHFRANQIKHRQLLADYKNSIDYYKLSLDDAKLLYNISERTLRYKQIQRAVKDIRNIEQHIKVNIQLINMRRKVLCVDLQELKKICEDIFNQVQYKIHKMARKFILSINGQMSIFQVQYKKDVKQENRQFDTIIPEWTQFNFTSEYEPTPKTQRGVRLSLPQDVPNEMMTSIDNREEWKKNELEQSFYSVQEKRSLDSSFLSPMIIQNNDQFPHFLTKPQSIAQSEIFHFPEWVMAYCKQVQENCQLRNREIKLLQEYLESFIRLSRTLKPATNEWFRYLNFQSALEDLMQLHDGTVHFIHEISQSFQVKLGVLTQLGIDLQNEQAMVFSVLNNQMQDLNQNKMTFLRSEGLLVNNRIVSLRQINLNYMQQNVRSQSELQFRQVINTSSNSILQVLSELRGHDLRALRTLADMVDALSGNISDSTEQLLAKTINLQRNYDEATMQSDCRQATIKLMQNHYQFKLLYLRSPASPSTQLLQHGISADMDITFKSSFDYQLYRDLPKPDMIVDTQEQDIETERLTPGEDLVVSAPPPPMYFMDTMIQIEANEQILNSFSCALQEKVLLSGRMFVTDKRLLFHSQFNSNNLFFGDTSLNIPKGDIQKIQKRTKAYIFDNSIQITTPKGTLFFTSFFARDQAYDLIIKVFAPKEQPELLIKENDEVTDIEDVGLIAYSDDQMQQMAERALRILVLIPENPKIFVKDFLFPLKSINVRKFFKLILSDGQVQTSSVLFVNKLAKLKNEGLGCTEFKSECWSPDPPLEFDGDQGGESLVKYEATHSTRTLTFDSPTPKTAIPFLPKACGIKETSKIYFVSLDKMVLDMEVETYRVPYCDSFVCYARQEITNQPIGIKVSTWVDITFVKSTMMRSTIEASSLTSMHAGTVNYMGAVERELEQYDRMQQKKSSKQDASIIPDAPSLGVGGGEAQKQAPVSATIAKYGIWILFLLMVMFALYTLYDRVLSRLEITINMKTDV